MMDGLDVLAVVGSLESDEIAYWLDGGWGVDALVGEQTRRHDDLDLVIELQDSERAMTVLEALGYALVEDERPTRFVLYAGERRIDFHTVSFDENGGGIQVLQDGRTYLYPPHGFEGSGVVCGRSMPCLTADVQVECHVGYEPDATDLHDMRLLHERCGVEVPPVFR